MNFSNYPDYQLEFIKTYNNVLKFLKTKIIVRNPLFKLNKTQIIKLGINLKVTCKNAWTCYNGYKKSYMKFTDSCKLRTKKFKEAH
ncbi:MAG: 7-cyano-7-deazaguanine synthase [Endomicrobium sp.]|nr:7-cyano-7-deazaguanine synthase [Endomicrobium sp.]